MIQELENKLIHYSNDLNININDTSILIAVSGGLDSILLSNLLINLQSKYSFKLSLVHFNHSIHDKSLEAEILCKNLAKKHKLKIYSDKIHVPESKNFESFSRKLRYEKLNDLASKYKINFIFTAHHYDDQIETLYMKYLDNADWISCIGIREKYGLIRRPLLKIKKSNILKYAKLNNLEWIDDSTNNDLKIRRNYVRLIQLPKIKNKCLEKYLINKSSISNNKMNFFLNRLDINKNNIIIKPNKYFHILNLEKIINYNIEELKILIYWFFSKILKVNISTYSRGFWLNFKNYLANSNTGSLYKFEKITFLQNRGELYVTKFYYKLQKAPKKIRLLETSKWYDSLIKINDCKSSVLENKNIRFISKEKIAQGIFIRRWRHGDIVYNNSSKGKLVSDLFIENKISIMSKLLYPIIVDKDDFILWVPGLTLSFDSYKHLKKDQIKLVEWIQI